MHGCPDLGARAERRREPRSRDASDDTLSCSVFFLPAVLSSHIFFFPFLRMLVFRRRRGNRSCFALNVVVARSAPRSAGRR